MIIDSSSPQVSLALSFVSLFSGYMGIKAVYDSSEGIKVPAGSGTLLQLIFFELLTGIGGYAGYATALNTAARSFPNKIVGIWFPIGGASCSHPALERRDRR